MRTKRNIKIVKSMFVRSLTEGIIDAQKVKLILKEIASQKPRNLISILKNYKRLIKSKIAKEEIILETGIKVTNLKKIQAELLKRTSARRMRFKDNPKLVFGAKITYGDWIYDATFDARLDKLLNG